jgi:hypothetical protein
MDFGLSAMMRHTRKRILSSTGRAIHFGRLPRHLRPHVTSVTLFLLGCCRDTS